MRVVLQRVSRAEVRIDGAAVGAIDRGLVALVGFREGDGAEEVRWIADKVVGLRIFGDGEGKMNLALDEVGGSILVVSQFTLYGNVAKGRRPSFVGAAHPDIAVPLYESFVAALEERVAGRVETGRFGAEMEVDLVNDGPVTLTIER